MIRKANKLQDIDRASEKNGIVWMTFARALPYFPSGILTAIGAVSRMSVRDYIIANLIGKFPSTALEVIIGHDIVNFHQYTVRLTLLVLLAAVIFYLGNGTCWTRENVLKTGTYNGITRTKTGVCRERGRRLSVIHPVWTPSPGTSPGNALKCRGNGRWQCRSS